MKCGTERLESLPAQPACEQGLLVWAQQPPNAVGMLPALKQSILENCGVIFLMDTPDQNNLRWRAMASTVYI